MSEDNPRKLKKLVKELERAAKDDPGNLVSKVKLAGAYRDLGQKSDAIKLYREVAHAYEAQGRRAQAVAVCRGILEIDPGEGETRVLLSRLESEAAAEPAGSGLPLPLLPGTMQGAVPAMPPRPAWLPKTSRGFASPTVPPPLLTPTPGPTPLPAPFPLGEDDPSTSAGSLWRMPSEPLILRGPPPPVQSGEPTFSGSQLPAPPSQRLESVLEQPTELRAASGPQRVQAPPQSVVERMPPGQEEEDAPTFMQEVTPLRPVGGALESRRSPLSGPSSLPPSSLPLSAPSSLPPSSLPPSSLPLSAPPLNVAPAQLHSPPPSGTQPMAVPTPLPPPPLRLGAQQASSPPPSVTQPMAVPTPLPPPPLPALSSPALPLPSPPMLPSLPIPSLSSPALPLPSPPSLGGRDDLDLMETHKVDRLEAAELFPPRQGWSEDTNPRSLQTMTAEVVSVADADGEHTSPGAEAPAHEPEPEHEYTPARRERRTRRMGSVAPPLDPEMPALAPTPRPPLGERLPPARPEPALPAAPSRTPATGARALAPEPRPQDPRSTGVRPAEPRPQDPRSTGVRPAEPRPQDPRSTGARPAEPRPQDPRSTGVRPAEPRAAAPASPRTPEPRAAAPASPRTPEPRAAAPASPRTPEPRPSARAPGSPPRTNLEAAIERLTGRPLPLRPPDAAAPPPARPAPPRLSTPAELPGEATTPGSDTQPGDTGPGSLPTPPPSRGNLEDATRPRAPVPKRPDDQHGPENTRAASPMARDGRRRDVDLLPMPTPSVDDELTQAFDGPFARLGAAEEARGLAIVLPLFEELPAEAHAEILRRMVIRRVGPGTLIVREGDPGDACYVIASGQVRVLKRTPDGRRLVEVARLADGALFGEFALLADRKRHASVEALTDVELFEIPRRLLDEIAVDHPGVGGALERFFRERLLSSLVATAPFFRALPAEQRPALAQLFHTRHVESGEVIIQEGESGGGLFLVVLGGVQIMKHGPTGPVPLAQLGEGAYFGEMSLLRGGVASATVVASDSSELAELPPRDFYQVVAAHPTLWEEIRREAARRELATHQILAGESNVV
ncbi:MAG: cyclic nucleotide-binding domain-containing protein [Deltaproteobacteria bacterium]|nr:cyclic nucleotide-binding domain-containing protein [Deltaproteobacteria bacterium]